MTLELHITPQGRFRVARDEGAGERTEAPGRAATTALSAALATRIEQAFAAGQGAGLAHLATLELREPLPPGLAFARLLAQRYFTQVCHLGDAEVQADRPLHCVPMWDQLSTWLLDAPPMRGLEYLDVRVLASAWTDLDDHVRALVAASGQGLRACLQELNPLWRVVGRVTFHLAENKRDEEYPFAFLATYASSISQRGEPQHWPLKRALKEHLGTAQNRRLAALLTPIREASQRLPWVAELIESQEIYESLAWTPAEAHRFLRDVPVLETSGLIVRIPNWWRSARPPRPQVSVRMGQKPAAVGADALLDFSVALTLDGETLTEAEKRELLAAGGGLVRLRGQWVEADGEQLAAALAHWKQVERDARTHGISFHEGMRLLAGASTTGRALEETPPTLTQWTGVVPGQWLQQLLADLREPEREKEPVARGLTATLRPYQAAGVRWLSLLTGLGLGACLADDMGLGKTIQVIALLLHLREQGAVSGGPRSARSPAAGPAPAHLIVAPASLMANWKAELQRFAPGLAPFVAHPAEATIDLDSGPALDAALAGIDIVITTYGVVTRSAALRRRRWQLVVLDEAQAIKNPGAQQSRAVKELAGAARIALTGTPVENRSSDLWSLFDFLNPGLLGDAKQFASLLKQLARRPEQPYAPLRKLIQPYILRRLKTDQRVISDLPQKTEVRTFCGLSREQAVLYEQCVKELAQRVGQIEGIQRRGAVLAALMQLKQICNHPAQWRGQGDYAQATSGKFQRIAELCAELAERQERVLIFTQFREMAEPLAGFLAGVFGRSGLVLHGGTAVAKRRALVEDFQRDDGPPFFVLSLKAGGTGLNLTAASHVIHFDRWWNPAVEAQATDRAFRIGQKRNVLVHKFVCRGTVEEKIDTLIESKLGLARDLLEEDGAAVLTEMSNDELLRTVALDIQAACAT
jgi:non-specific serine/threonine protein kinase